MNAELVEHEVGDEGVKFEVRQGVRAEHLPSVARTVVGGDYLMIDRSETWRSVEDGHYTGEVAASIPGIPGSITGSMWLRDLDSPSEGSDAAVSEFVVEGMVKVNVPFLGGKLEDLVADQVQKLLSAEERFTADWLAQQR